jgi:hypothetical protein
MNNTTTNIPPCPPENMAVDVNLETQDAVLQALGASDPTTVQATTLNQVDINHIVAVAVQAAIQATKACQNSLPDRFLNKFQNAP